MLDTSNCHGYYVRLEYKKIEQKILYSLILLLRTIYQQLATFLSIFTPGRSDKHMACIISIIIKK